MRFRLNGNKFTKRYKKLRLLTNEQWKNKLDYIENKYLKRKVAALLWFDMCDHTIHSSYLKEESNKYMFDIDNNKTKEKDVEAELYRIGYPAWFAYFRSLTPKTHDGGRRSNNGRHRSKEHS